MRRTEGQIKGGSTTQMKIVGESGAVTKLTNKDDIHNTVAVGNDKVGHQTEGGIQLLNP